MDNRTITFTLPKLPPSVNALYQVIYAQRRVELKPEYRAWKSGMKQYVPRFEVGEGATLRIDCEFNFAFSKRRFDCANLLKVLIDCVADRLGFNDRIIRHGSWCSIDSETEYVRVTLTEVTNASTND